MPELPQNPQPMQTPQTPPAPQKKSSMVTTLLIIAVLAGGSYGVYSMNRKDGDDALAVDQNAAPAVAQQDVPSAVSATYKDGDYSVVGTYNSPAGAETMGVSLTLKDNIITAVTIEPKANAPISKKFQETVADSIKPFVVGKRIDAVKLSKISGSSLTPKGFNDALEKVKVQAKV